MLWELWRRLDPTSFAVLTTPHPDGPAWDAAQPYRVERTPERVLLPTPRLLRRIEELADDIGATTVILDPALPLGLLGPRLRRPYAVVLHGAEVTVPGRLPGLHLALRHVLRGAGLVVAAGGYPLAEGERAAGRPLPSVLVPPGVDTGRFRPLDAAARAATRERFGLSADGPLVVSLSRLVPRKGMDVLIEAAALLAPERPDLTVAIGGGGRDEDRLARLAQRRRHPSACSGGSPMPTCPLSTAPATSTPCSAGTGGPGSSRRGSASSSSRRPSAGVPQIAGRQRRGGRGRGSTG